MLLVGLRCGDNLSIKHEFTKYLKESCGFVSDQHFQVFFKIFSSHKILPERAGIIFDEHYRYEWVKMPGPWPTALYTAAVKHCWASLTFWHSKRPDYLTQIQITSQKPLLQRNISLKVALIVVKSMFHIFYFQQSCSVMRYFQNCQIVCAVLVWKC